MKRSHRTLWRKLVIGVLTLPLLQTSCVELAQRALIDGFSGAVTPLLNECLEERLAAALESNADP